MEINQIIRTRREELGLTMKELADRVGVSEGTISRWEGGQIQNMKRDKIVRLAEALEVPLPVLMDWEEYDAERVEKNKIAKELCELANVSNTRNVEIALDLLKKLEGKG